MMNKPRRAAARAGIDWLKGHPERRLLVLARCHVMPPEVTAWAVAQLDGKRKPPVGLCYLGTEDFRHGQTPELTRAETEAIVLVDGLHEPMDPSAVDLAGFVIEQRHHTNLPTIISTVLSPDELGPWLRYHRYDAADSLVARLGHAPSALVIDCVTQRLPDAPAPALPAHAYGADPVRLGDD
jgi:hypothetical protein